MIKKWLKRTALVLGTLLAFALPAQATDYTFDYFLAPGQTSRSHVLGLNNNGIATGRPDNPKHYYVYDGTNFTFTDVTNYPSDYPNRIVFMANGINDSGVIAGTIDWYSQRHKGFTLTDGTLEYFRMKPTWVTYAADIANDGTIVGYGAQTNTSIRESYILRNGIFEYVIHPLDAGGTILRGISSDGLLTVGRYIAAEGPDRQFLYDGANFYDLPFVPGSDVTTYWDINVHGIAVCNYRTPDLVWNIALYDYNAGTFETITAPTISTFWYARTINDDNVIGAEMRLDGIRYGVIVTPVPLVPLPIELSIDAEKYKLMYDRELLTGIMKATARLELLPETVTSLADGTILQGVTVTIVFPGLGIDGGDLILSDQFDVNVTSKPGVLKLKQAE